MLSCGCVNNQCAYRANGIPCTDMCKLKNCSNSVAIEESDDDDDDDDDDNEQVNDSEVWDNSDEDEIQISFNDRNVLKTS